MAKVHAEVALEELEDKESFELEKTRISIPSLSSSLPSQWKARIPGFNWRFHSDARCLRNTFSSNLAALPVCDCRKCLREAKKRTSGIDVQLGKDAQDAKNDRIILIMGVGSDTNAQVAKLLMRVDKDPYTPDELEENKRLIRETAFDRMLWQLQSWNLGGKTPGNADEKALVNLEVAVEKEGKLILEHALAFEALWIDYLGRKSHILTEGYTCEFLLHQVARIASPDFTPSESDILNLPSGNLRLAEIVFMHCSSPSKAESRLKLRMMNYHESCGNGKRIWPFFADTTSAVVIPIDLTHYVHLMDETSENYHNNVLQGQIFAFVQCYSRSRMLSSMTFILWLGNVTLFKTMVGKEEGGLDRYMKDCKAGNDGDRAVEWVVENLLKENTRRIGKDIFIFLLDVLDAENVKKAVSDLGDVLLAENVKKAVSDLGDVLLAEQDVGSIRVSRKSGKAQREV